MPELETVFRYAAVSPEGKRVRGVIAAPDEAAAFQRLRISGLSPLRLRPEGGRQTKTARGALSERECVELVANLGHLLSAGADMRTALGILGARASRRQISAACRALGAEIGGGAPLDASFARLLGKHGPFVGAMVAAGEAAGDLAGGLSRAAEIIDTRGKLKRKLASILAYPGFVLASTVAAVLALLLFVIPSLAPLVQGSAAPPPASLRLMLAASEAVQAHLIAIEMGAILLAAGLVLAHRAGLLQKLVDRLLLTGPVRRTASAIVYGSFSVVLGGMLSAGAPMSDALRLAVRAVASPLASRRLDPVIQEVRQGQALSAALERVAGFPRTISSLAAVGEASGSLGPMLVRSGKLEEEAALARIEVVGQMLGPILIVSLGGLVGLLMAGLLSGVSQLGQSALQ